LVLAGEGYRLVDLGSTNGTYVNDSRIDEHELQSGDTLRIGQTVMAYLTSGDRDDGERTVMLDRLGPSLPALPARGGFEALEPRGINLPSADEGMSLSDLIGKLIGVWGFIRRYWPWLVALPILFGAMGLSTLRLIPPKESASFTVNFVPAPARNPVERSWERPPNGG